MSIKVFDAASGEETERDATPEEEASLQAAWAAFDAEQQNRQPSRLEQLEAEVAALKETLAAITAKGIV